MSEVIGTVCKAVIDWLGKQQAVTVVLIGVLASLLYGMNIHVPSILQAFREEVQLERKHNSEELKETRATFDAANARHMTLFENTVDKMLNKFQSHVDREVEAIENRFNTAHD